MRACAYERKQTTRVKLYARGHVDACSKRGVHTTMESSDKELVSRQYTSLAAEISCHEDVMMIMSSDVVPFGWHQ